MANEVASVLRCDGFAPPFSAIQASAPANFAPAPAVNLPVGGVRFPEGAITSFYHVFRVPAAVALATGLSIEIAYVIPWNVANADLRGTRIYLGVTVGVLTTNASFVDDSALAASTEVAVQSGALPTVAGRFLILPIAVPLASLGGLAANATALFRLRRLGTNALDTYGGEINVVNIDIRNT